MDDQNAGEKRDVTNLECRPPVEADVVALCRELNQRGARYVVVAWFRDHCGGVSTLHGRHRFDRGGRCRE